MAGTPAAAVEEEAREGVAAEAADAAAVAASERTRTELRKAKKSECEFLRFLLCYYFFFLLFFYRT